MGEYEAVAEMQPADIERLRALLNIEDLPKPKAIRCLLHYEPGCPCDKPKEAV